ncbi:thioesterase-like superfamily-domain-containing protein [Stachybotrys elegans]|uniref:Thioesterase-like superfamily-domain-containing protein n=1 Tax=Stachybotrys elegans TaxID=80388 RepID=A0A8K0WUK9_9HYPO|nr:thioesterase-like superfamily-domain-containing protein [Stachybotrys elegans]
MLRPCLYQRPCVRLGARVPVCVSRRQYTSPPGSEAPAAVTAAAAASAAPLILGKGWYKALKTDLEGFKRIVSDKEVGLSGEQRKRLVRFMSIWGRSWLSWLLGTSGFLPLDKVGGLDQHQVMWGDMDTMGIYRLSRHVNNVTYNKYAEASRVNWLTKFGYDDRLSRKEQLAWRSLMTPTGPGMIMKSIYTDYKFPLRYPDNIFVVHRLTKKPDETSSSIFLEAMICSQSHRRVAARCFEELVFYDYDRGTRAEIPDYMLSQFIERYEQQELHMEKMKQHVGKTILEVIRAGQDPVVKREIGGLMCYSQINKAAIEVDAKGSEAKEETLATMEAIDALTDTLRQGRIQKDAEAATTGSKE